MPEITVPARLDQLDEVNAFLEGIMEAFGCSMRTVNAVLMSVEEAFVNVAHYSGSPEVRLDCAVSDEGFMKLTISDSGVPYDPLAAAEPDISLSAEERRIGGLGVLMYKKLMDGVSYRYSGGRNELTMEKRLIN